MATGRFLQDADAEIVDRDQDPGGPRQLLRIKLERDEDLVALSCHCPVDGSPGTSFVSRRKRPLVITLRPGSQASTIQTTIVRLWKRRLCSERIAMFTSLIDDFHGLSVVEFEEAKSWEGTAARLPCACGVRRRENDRATVR